MNIINTKLIKNLDLSNIKVNLLFNNKINYQSNFGGILSFFYIIILFYILVSYIVHIILDNSYKLVKKEIIKNNEFNNEYISSINYFNIAFRLETNDKKLLNQDNKLFKYYVNLGIDNKLAIKNCDIKDFPYNTNNFGKYDLNNYYCLNLNDLINAKFDNYKNNVFSISIAMCNESNICEESDSIVKYLNDGINLSIININAHIDTSDSSDNYNNIFNYNLNKKTYKLERNMLKSYTFILNEQEYINDMQFITSIFNKNLKRSISINKLNSDYQIYDNSNSIYNSKKDIFLIKQTYILNNKKNINIYTCIKLHEILANIGGILFFFSFLYSNTIGIYNSMCLEYDLIKTTMKLNVDNIALYPNKLNNNEFIKIDENNKIFKNISPLSRIIYASSKKDKKHSTNKIIQLKKSNNNSSKNNININKSNADLINNSVANKNLSSCDVNQNEGILNNNHFKASINNYLKYNIINKVAANKNKLSNKNINICVNNIAETNNNSSTVNCNLIKENNINKVRQNNKCNRGVSIKTSDNKIIKIIDGNKDENESSFNTNSYNIDTFGKAYLNSLETRFVNIKSKKDNILVKDTKELCFFDYLFKSIKYSVCKYNNRHKTQIRLYKENLYKFINLENILKNMVIFSKALKFLLGDELIQYIGI